MFAAYYDSYYADIFDAGLVTCCWSLLVNLWWQESMAKTGGIASWILYYYIFVAL